MDTQILDELIKKYNITDTEIFGLNVKKALLGEVKPEDVGYNLHMALNLDLNTAVELAAEIEFLSNEEKKQALAELEGFIKQTVNIEADIKAIIYQSNISLDENLTDRLIKLIISYLQDVRNEYDFKDALTRAPKIAGIGLNNEDADNLISKLKVKKEEWQKSGINFKAAAMGANVQESEIDVVSTVTAPKTAFQPLASDEVTIDQILKQRAQSTGRPTQMPQTSLSETAGNDIPFVKDIEAEENFLEGTEELMEPRETGKMSKEGEDGKEGVNQMSRIESPSIRPPEIRQPLIRQTDQTNSRQQMSDVKFEPKLYGPLDELAAMSLADFRRLSKDPWQSIQKISGKLGILEGESMVRKNEGVKALKSSPLYNIYADIMNRALVEAKSFEQVIAERGDINITEFKAIMELNKSLKY